MLSVSADGVDAALTFGGLVETLREAFRAGAVQPVRHHHTIERPDGAASTLLLMPAWTDFVMDTPGRGHIGVKVVTVSPDNNALGKPAVMGLYLLLDGRTGEPQALIDGPQADAMADRLCVRACCLLPRSQGRLAASGDRRRHALPIPGEGAFGGAADREIAIWNRTLGNAETAAEALRKDGVNAVAVADLNAALAEADIVSSATIATDPLIKGARLKPGAHVDLVGGFTPHMREADDDAIQRARVYVDTRAGATKEAGDIVQPLATGVLKPEAIVADLHELARGEKHGRVSAEEITLFKSVGAALEDLAAGVAVYRKSAGRM